MELKNVSFIPMELWIAYIAGGPLHEKEKRIPKWYETFLIVLVKIK